MKLLFIHGSGAPGAFWYYQTSYFQDSEAPSLPGHPEGQPCTSVEDYTDWLRGYIHDKGYQGVVLAGHSLGGAVALKYALQCPEDLNGLILLGTGARLRVHPMMLTMCAEGIKDREGWAKSFELQYANIPPEIASKLGQAMMEIGPAVQLSDLLCCDKFDVMNEIHQIKLPTLVICGSEDTNTPVKYSQYLVNNIEGAKQVIIEGGTHVVAVEKPHEVNQAIEEFVCSL